MSQTQEKEQKTCGCMKGSTCTISHDPSTCPCEQCTQATRSNISELDVRKFKKWAKKYKNLAETVCLAKAFSECERERVNAYILPIFESFKFTIDIDDERSGEPITDPDHLDLSNDEEKCAEYYAACDKAHREHGFTGPMGHCPALIAENLLIKAENALLDALGLFVGIDGGDFSRSLEIRAKALDFALTGCLGNVVY